VLIPGAVTPKLVTKEMISMMQSGSVVVDVSIDQGAVLKQANPPPIKIQPIWSMM
jgi:alanine dehydrogenase